MLSFIVSILLIGSTVASENSIDYEDQANWPPICVTGNNMRQSPINIVTDEVRNSEKLIELQLNGWESAHDGEFKNNGHSLQFNPDLPKSATTHNHLGTYDLLQFHMHWGARTGQGSEHLVDGAADELEIHFVHVKQGSTDETAGDHLMVVGVRAKVDEHAPLTGPWVQLNAAAVQGYDSSTCVKGFRFSHLLPAKREYYFYEGSLTTPPCSETVAWFMMKDTITVPGAYLEQLRKTREDCQGKILEFNFRNPQVIGNRVVTTRSSPTSPPPPVELPDVCYIKVHTSQEGKYLTTSRRVGEYRRDTARLDLSSDSETCIRIKCPKQAAEAVFAVGSITQGDCAPKVNSHLPKSLDHVPNNVLSVFPTPSIYIQQFDASRFLQGTNGLFTSRATCQSSTSIGLNYDCVQVVNTDKNFVQSLVAKISQLVDNDSETRLKMQLLSLSQNEEKLVSLMEETLQQLKSFDKTEEDLDRVVSQTSDDSLLASKLEEIMEQLD